MMPTSSSTSKLLWWLLLWLPVMLYISVGAVFSQQTVKHLPIAVVDQNQSTQSRALVRDLNSMETLALQSSISVKEATQALRRSDIYAVILIPEDFSSDLVRNQQPMIEVLVNGEYVLIAKIISASIAQVTGVSQAVVQAEQTLALTSSPTTALFTAAPVQMVLNPLYNPIGNYALFLLPGIFIAIWQVLIATTTSTILVDRPEGKFQTNESWIKSAESLTIIFKKIAWSFPLLWLQGLIALSLLFYIFNWPFFGSLVVISLVALFFVLATQALAICVCLVFTDPTEAISISGALTAPSFAFLGITFPKDDMPWLALLWRDLLPAAHFSEWWVAIASYDSITRALTHGSIAMILIMLLPVVFIMIKRGINRDAFF